MAEYNTLKRSICLSKQRIKDVFRRRNTFGDVITVTDEIRVYEGKETQICEAKGT